MVPRHRAEVKAMREQQPAAGGEVGMAEVSRRLRVSRSQARRYLLHGLLKGRRVGPKGWWRVDRVSLEALERGGGPTNPTTA
jgi:hypothetical protein